MQNAIKTLRSWSLHRSKAISNAPPVVHLIARGYYRFLDLSPNLMAIMLIVHHRAAPVAILVIAEAVNTKQFPFRDS